jgi:hypothetical protein
MIVDSGHGDPGAMEVPMDEFDRGAWVRDTEK